MKNNKTTKPLRWKRIEDPESDLTIKRVNGHYDVVRSGDSWSVYTPHDTFVHTKAHGWVGGNRFVSDCPVTRDQAREFAELMIRQYK